MTAKVIQFKETAKKCSFCGRDLIEGKDRFMENEHNGKIICFNPCVIKAQALIEKDEVKGENAPN
jgi:ribosomal protein L24E